MNDNFNITTLATDVPTITHRMGRHGFNIFLHQIQGNPDGEAWKKPTALLSGGDINSKKFYMIEVFANTQIGLVVAKHEDTVAAEVIVTMPHPSDGTYRPPKQVIDEAWVDAQAR